MHTELHVGAGRRIDICIVDSAKPRDQVLGIEVKTSSASARSNQLEEYHKGLSARYPSADIAIAYLTPFNRQRAGTSSDRLPTIGVFEEFARRFDHACHLSWLDIANIEWDGRDIWRQHQEYVRDTIARQSKLDHDALGNHSFDVFFGAEPAARFWEALDELDINPPGDTGAEIDLSSLNADANSLVRAFEILVVDGEGVAHGKKSDRFTCDQRQSFITSRHREFHEALFGLSQRFGNVWTEGKKDYAIRVAHKRYGSGVSLVRSKGEASLETGRPRRAREP